MRNVQVCLQKRNRKIGRHARARFLIGSTCVQLTVIVAKISRATTDALTVTSKFEITSHASTNSNDYLESTKNFFHPKFNESFVGRD